MNSCVLMAEIIQDPQLRYTSDNQTPIAEMLVQFPGLRADDPAATLKVIGWGNLAQEIHQQYHQGDRVVIEGRLGMNLVDRPEGFREKRAELTVQRIHRLELDMAAAPATPTAMDRSAPAPARNRPAAQPAARSPQTESFETPGSYSIPSNEPDFDDIPF